MYIAMLGRQPAIGIAELERLYSDVRWFGHDSALVNNDSFQLERLGGTVKAGLVVRELSGSDWRKTSMELVRVYTSKWSNETGKITVGISAYGFKITPQDVQRTAHILKSKLKQKGVSLRTVPNEQAALNSASSHHNKLGTSLNKVELLVVRGHNGKIIIAESIGAQNITALARRDQERPMRDAFVGMLPPKLAQIMINLAGPLETSASKQSRILDPFCGTGVVLQEASLMSYAVYGTDLSEKMIRYSDENLKWLKEKYSIQNDWQLEVGDAMDHKWSGAINAVVGEAYLGQPFSAPPSAEKLQQVVGNCDHIISSFLKNIGSQIESGTPLCLAVPAWNDGHDRFTHLPLVKKLDDLGYKPAEFHTISAKDLLYFRPEQVVARELLVLQKK